MTSISIPPNWTALLKRLQDVAPSAVLAGGALRDLDNGREVKDLDVFIRCGSEREAEMLLQNLLEATFAVTWDKAETTVYPEDQNLEVVAVMDLTGFELPVQIICTTWPTEAIVERFDYGICRLAWDGITLVRPDEYDADKTAQVFRLCRDRPTPLSLRGSVKRYARLLAKYPGWDWRAGETQSGWGAFDFIDAHAVFAADPFPT